MKIAYIAQPMDMVIPPKQNSIGIIIYEIAKRMSVQNDVGIFVNNGNSKTCDNIKIFNVNNKIDRYINLINKYLNRPKRLENITYPYFASQLYYLAYSLKVALRVRQLKYEVVHIINFSQFIPAIRALNPEVKIVIHMECEWLSQLEFYKILQRINKADLIVGCSEYITDQIRYRYPATGNSCYTIFNGANILDSDIKTQRSLNNRSKYSVRQGENYKIKNKRLLFVGRLSPEKGVHILLKAFLILIQKIKNISLFIRPPA